MILFLRHAESEWNARFSPTRIDPGLPDPPLTPRGRKQAEELAVALDRAGVRHLLVSPYRRALETAHIIRDRLAIPVEVEPLVRERVAFSCDLGTPASLLRAQWPAFRFDGLPEIWWSRQVESDESVAARCRAFRARARHRDWPRPLAVVSHWGFLRMLLGRRLDNAEVLRLEWARFLEPGDPSP